MRLNKSGFALKLRRATATFILCVAAACVSGAQAVSFTADLTGANEAPPNASANTGTTRIKIDSINNTLSWRTISTIPVAAITDHHIHQGAAGTNGSVAVNFLSHYSGTLTISATLAAAIIANPASFYVNVHSVAYGGGSEIRSQLVADPLV
jgi:hypothetical protein